MEVLIRRFLCIWLCIFLISATSFKVVFMSPSSACPREHNTFLHDLNFQCGLSIPFSAFPIQMDGESFDKAMSSGQNNVYTAVLFYASWCPFSNLFRWKFSALSSMFPQIKHVMIEQSSALPSVFSKYGVHSVPSLLLVNQTARIRYNGRKDLPSLINFYKRTTGLDPVGMVEDASSSQENGWKYFQLWSGATLTDTFLGEPYLVLSVLFVVSRALFYFFPGIVSRFMALWSTFVPHLNLGIIGEARQLLERVLHLIDIKRLWSKLKLCKTRNFHKGARNARVWASSLASVSLGETSSSRVLN